MITIWNQFISTLMQEYPTEYSMWFSSHRFFSSSDIEGNLEVPSLFLKERLSSRYAPQIQQYFAQHGHPNFVLHIHVNERLVGESEAASNPVDLYKGALSSPHAVNDTMYVNRSVPLSKKSKIVSQIYPLDNINQNYTFETFVQGPCNDMAVLAAQKVCSNPGRTFNPLYIHGGIGVGKTHLLHSIANKVHHENPMLKIVYSTAEQFMQDFTHSITSKSKTKFREKYYDVDILMIDDIQFAQNWQKTQDEMFTLSNLMILNNKQIVVSGNLPPSTLKIPNKQLISRFNSGLVIEMSPPDKKTRLVFIKQFLTQKSIHFSNETILYLTKNFKRNFRDLYAALLKLSFSHELFGHLDLPLQDIQLILKDLLYQPQHPSYISIDRIQDITAHYFQVTVIDLKSKSRKQNIVRARQMAMYLCRRYASASLKDIGMAFNGRDHSTVVASIRKIEQEKSENSIIANAFREIRNRIVVEGI